MVCIIPVKKLRFFNYWIVVLICVAILASCAPRAQVPVMRPAEIYFKGKQRLAVGSFNGNVGPATSDILTSKLFSNGYFELVERQHMRNIMREHDLSQMGMLDDSTAIRQGSMTGASVFVYGTSSAKFNIEMSKSEWKDKKGRHIKYTKQGIGRVTTTFKVVDLASSKLLAVKTLSGEGYGETSEDDYYPPSPDRDSIISQAISNVTDDFIKAIAPHVEYVTVEFESNDSDLPEIDSGINFCKMGKWGEGIKQFFAATKKNPSSASAWFNLGLAYEYSYMFEEAEAAFMQANKIKPSDRCIAEISNVQRMENDHKKLDSQEIEILKPK